LSHLKGIVGSVSRRLEGRRIVLCITGSVAAMEAPRLARELMRHGADVHVVMSRAACRLIGPDLMEWATGNPVVTELTGRLEHVELAGEWEGTADLVLVYPATANTISKVACGIDDTPVTTVVSTALGSRIPVLVAPAMHYSMYRNPFVVESLRRLSEGGVKVIQPRIEEGKAKVASVEEAVEEVLRELSPKDYSGVRALVTAGPTVEYIDPVRVVTNMSSGKMGIELAKELYRRGAEVKLVYGPGTVQPPSWIETIRVVSAQDMLHVVESELSSREYSLFIGAAAVSDYTPEEPLPGKLSTKEVKELTVKLVQTPKVLEAVRRASRSIRIVAFKAEFGVSREELVEKAREKLREIEAEMVIANDLAKPGAGFRSNTNQAIMVDKTGAVLELPLMPKSELAKVILDHLAKLRG